MKVKYVELRDGVVGPWLNGGEIYSVLAIHADVSGIRYRIISDASQTPALYHASLFKIISHHIPSSWIVNVGNNGDFIEMASEPWTASD